MKENEVRLFGMKIKPEIGQFGLDLNEDRADCQVGIICRTDNGRFVIRERRWDEETKELHLTLERDLSNRKGRRQRSKKVRK